MSIYDIILSQTLLELLIANDHLRGTFVLTDKPPDTLHQVAGSYIYLLVEPYRNFGYFCQHIAHESTHLGELLVNYQRRKLSFARFGQLPGTHKKLNTCPCHIRSELVHPYFVSERQSFFQAFAIDCSFKNLVHTFSPLHSLFEEQLTLHVGDKTNIDLDFLAWHHRNIHFEGAILQRQVCRNSPFLFG